MSFSYKITTCTPFADIDECIDPESNDCDANAACNNTEGSYTCLCPNGYQGDGKICVGMSKLYAIAGNYEWFIVLFTSVVIGRSNCFGVGDRRSFLTLLMRLSLVLVCRQSFENLSISHARNTTFKGYQTSKKQTLLCPGRWLYPVFSWFYIRDAVLKFVPVL